MDMRHISKQDVKKVVNVVIDDLYLKFKSEGVKGNGLKKKAAVKILTAFFNENNDKPQSGGLL